jgi:hypothetical protein
MPLARSQRPSAPCSARHAISVGNSVLSCDDRFRDSVSLLCVTWYKKSLRFMEAMTLFDNDKGPRWNHSPENPLRQNSGMQQPSNLAKQWQHEKWYSTTIRATNVYLNWSDTSLATSSLPKSVVCTYSLLLAFQNGVCIQAVTIFGRGWWGGGARKIASGARTEQKWNAKISFRHLLL